MAPMVTGAGNSSIFQWQSSLLTAKFANGKVRDMKKARSLSDWIASNAASQAAFAELIGCSESHLSLILSGDRSPSYNLAKRISKATSNAISVDLIFSEIDKIRAVA